MAYELLNLVIDRVDLVDEGANSAAFIELYKRKEKSEPMDFNEILSKMKPEHAEVISKAVEDKDTELAKAREDLDTANQIITEKDAELAKAREDLEAANVEIETLKAKPADEPSEEELLKSMPDAARELFQKMRAQKEAAEEQVRKEAAEKAEAEAVAKAAGLKAIPVEQAKLISVVKGCSEEVLEILKAANAAIETAVLGEVGKNRGNGADTTCEDAWNQIEKRAEEIAKRDNVTKEKAVSIAISENPELYKQYLEGGAN